MASTILGVNPPTILPYTPEAERPTLSGAPAVGAPVFSALLGCIRRSPFATTLWQLTADLLFQPMENTDHILRKTRRVPHGGTGRLPLAIAVPHCIDGLEIRYRNSLLILSPWRVHFDMVWPDRSNDERITERPFACRPIWNNRSSGQTGL